jgi:glycosyltransferase involved in cell wall biosynthesis
MKILAIQNFMSQGGVGGAELMCHDVFSRLVQRGHRVNVLTAGPEKYDKEYAVLPILDAIPHVDEARKLKTLPAKIRWSTAALKNYRATKQAIIRQSPDVVYVHNLEWTTMSPLSAAIGSGVRTVIHAHNHHYWEHWKNHFNVSPSFNQRILRTTPPLEKTHIIAISNSVAVPFRNSGFPPERIEVVFNGLPDEAFTPVTNGPREHKALFIGAISSHKGLHVAIEAIAVLKQRSIIIPLEIIGAGTNLEYRKHLDGIVNQHGLTNVITFVGQCSRQAVWERMRLAKFVVMPSLCEEAFGLVAAEAMACGAIPIVSDRGALPEVVGVQGFVAEPTAKGFADTIKRANETPEQAKQEIRKKAYDHVYNNYRLIETIDRIEKTLMAT